MEKHVVEELYGLAAEYIETLPRDKRIVAARYIARLKQNPIYASDMGFLQYVEAKVSKPQEVV